MRTCDPILPGLTVKYAADGSASFLCPDKADRHQDLAQELTGRPERFISAAGKKRKNPFMFYYKKRGGKMIVDRLLLLWVEKETQCEADDDIQCGATGSEQTSVAPITAPF